MALLEKGGRAGKFMCENGLAERRERKGRERKLTHCSARSQTPAQPSGHGHRLRWLGQRRGGASGLSRTRDRELLDVGDRFVIWRRIDRRSHGQCGSGRRRR